MQNHGNDENYPMDNSTPSTKATDNNTQEPKFAVENHTKGTQQVSNPDKEENKTKKTASYKISKAGIAEKTFQTLSNFSLPILLLLAAAICFQQFVFTRDFWFSEEVRLADVYMNMLTSKDYFQLTLNGAPYTQTLPVFFWSILLVDAIPQINMPQAFFLATAIFSLLFVASTWLFARGLGYSKQIAFAAGLITLCTFSFLGLSNYIRMDLLFAFFITNSLLCFYRAWRKEFSICWLTVAFIFMTFAVMTHGIFAFIMPLIASLFFLLWSGKIRRLNRRDGLPGFAFFLCIMFAWSSVLMLDGHDSYLNALIQEQIISPFTNSTDEQPFWYYLFALPIIFFPWICIILFANWLKIPRIFINSFKNRKNISSDMWLICIIIASVLFLSVTRDKIGVNLIPLLPPLSILTAKILLQFSPISNRLFWGFLSIIIFFVGSFLILFEFHAHILDYIPFIRLIPDEIPTYIRTVSTDTYFGLAAMGILCIILAFILGILTRRKFAGGSLIVFCIGCIIAIQPFTILVAPQLDSILSPKNQAKIMAEHKNDGYGYVPASYKIPKGIYTYYYNIAQNKPSYPQDSIESIHNEQNLLSFLSTHPKVIVAMPLTIWETLDNKNGATFLQKQWLESKEMALILWEAPQLNPIVPSIMLPPSEFGMPTVIPNIQQEQTPRKKISKDTTKTNSKNDIKNTVPNKNIPTHSKPLSENKELSPKETVPKIVTPLDNKVLDSMEEILLQKPETTKNIKTKEEPKVLNSTTKIPLQKPNTTKNIQTQEDVKALDPKIEPKNNQIEQPLERDQKTQSSQQPVEI